MLDKTPDPDYADPEYVDREHRAINPEFLVVRGVCTHLGCVPVLRGDDGKRTVGDWWRGGFICPCHQSGYDYAGRVVRGPAPRNLPVPPHRFASPTPNRDRRRADADLTAASAAVSAPPPQRSSGGKRNSLMFASSCTPALLMA